MRSQAMRSTAREGGVRATGAPDSRRILSILQSTIMIQLTSRRILRD